MKLLILALIALATPAHSASLRLDGASYVGLLHGVGQSCERQVKLGKQAPPDLGGVKALIGTLHLSWSGPGKLKLESLTITFPGKEFPGGKQEATVTGAELGYLWENQESPVVFSAQESRSSTPFCFFQVGNLSVVDPYEYFEGVGTVRAVGTHEGGSVSTELPFRFHYNPILRR